MGYAKQYLNYESIDIYGAQEAVKAIRSDHRVFSTTQSLANKETANGFLVVSAEIESENHNQHAVNIVLRSVVNFFESRKHDNPIDALKDAVQQANRQLYFSATHDDNLKGITLSIIAALIRDKQLYYAYVGNNNLFHASNGSVKRLTPGVSQVEDDEMEEIPLVNSSRIDPDLTINVSDRPVTPENGDYFLICPKSYVYTSDDFIVDIFGKKCNLDDMAGKMLTEALGRSDKRPKTFSIIQMNLIGGKGSDEDDISRLYGGILAKLISFMTSPIALIGMGGFIIILLLILYGLM